MTRSFVIIVVLALAHCAQAQTTQWQSYRQGFTTMTDGSDGTHIQSWQQGFTTMTDIHLPDGAVRHCTSYRQGFTVRTECNE
jgi:hypothetical protein